MKRKSPDEDYDPTNDIGPSGPDASKITPADDGTNSNQTSDQDEKRSKTESSNNKPTESMVSPPPSTNRSTPLYGSKEYWEARYKSHHMPQLPDESTTTEGTSGEDEENSGNKSSSDVPSRETPSEKTYLVDGVELSKEAIRPGHAWYFSYEELRPLIMPLVLGNFDDASIALENESRDGDEESWIEEEEEVDCLDGDDESEGGDDIENVNDEDDKKSNERSSEDEKKAGGDCKLPVDTTKDEESEANDLSGELRHVPDDTERRPKKVLEIGCGDVPLGASLAVELVAMQSATGFDAKLVVEEVTCIDYSEIVINSLVESQRRELKEDKATSTENTESPPNSDQLRPSYLALDARNLPFSSNTYDLILEKGTLDAMLSDSEEGIPNCVEIVKEMARVTREGGAILIVSHLNANEPKGMSWLEDVLFRGLKKAWKERREERKRLGGKKAATASEEEKNGIKDKFDTEHDEEEEKEVVWSVEVHGGDGKMIQMNENGEGFDENDGDSKDGENDERGETCEVGPIYGPAVYIVRKKCVPASVARELFAKKKVKNDDEKEGDGVDNGDDEEEFEMPPVKLEFLTYES